MLTTRTATGVTPAFTQGFTLASSTALALTFALAFTLASALGATSRAEASAQGSDLPLIRAILADDFAASRSLLDDGADFEAPRDVASELIAGLVPVDQPGPVKMTPLIAAAMVGSTQLVTELLDRGASLEGRGEHGATALHLAAMAGHRETVEVLLSRGASLAAATASGQSPLEFAHMAEQTEIAELLRGAGSGNVAIPIDVQGHYTIAAFPSRDTEADDNPWQRNLGVVPVGIAVTNNATVVWTQYRTGTIHSVGPEGGNPKQIAEAEGALGLASNRLGNELFYTSDRRYPRSVNSLALGTQPNGTRAGESDTDDSDRSSDGPLTSHPLVSGSSVNRPFAIAVAEDAGRIYWSESINGRIRSAALSGNDLTTVIDDGISSTNERQDATAMSSFGIAVDENAGLLFWSDILGGGISQAGLNGEKPRMILGPRQGLQFPTGLAVDPIAKKLYWADPGTERIGRANYDGTDSEIIADAEQGVLEPYGLALDPSRNRLYWTDRARNAIWAKDLETGEVAKFQDLTSKPELDAKRSFLPPWLKRVRTCLIKLAALKAVKRSFHDAGKAAALCERQLGGLGGDGKLQASVAPPYSGDENQAWFRAQEALGARTIAADFPRAAEWLRDVRPFLEHAPDGTRDETPRPQPSKALKNLDTLLSALPERSGNPDLRQAWTLPSSGQVTRYLAVNRQGDVRPTAVPDDGAVRAGKPAAFRDNGDGTITDLATGLMWEKKCRNCEGLHAVDLALVWKSGEADKRSEDRKVIENVETWLAALNAETSASKADPGFAGYQDWRLPSFDELLGIVDFERFNPAVNSAFDGSGCAKGCQSVADPNCSCTQLDKYWSKTPAPFSQSGDTENTVVVFNLGLVRGLPQHEMASVRAVRGPRDVAAPRFVDQGDGTIVDQTTRLVWEKKCDCPGNRHDFRNRYPWSSDGDHETIWDWLAGINEARPAIDSANQHAQGAPVDQARGFAGHSDWRIPNVKELATLLDHGRSDSSIHAAFTADQCPELAAKACSWTEPGLHWTSTTFADFPAHALGIAFHFGYIDDRLKTQSLPVRAVRGPLPHQDAE